jgi:hypothetical protein
MLAKPKLKTGVLSSPTSAGPYVVAKAVTSTSATPFDGQPDPNSPAQRTMHQSLANRLVGQSNLYHWLREYAFRVIWHHLPEEAEGVRLTMAVIHQGDGPKVAIVLKNAQWSTTITEHLVDRGWHVLTFDSTAMVQAPQEAVSDIVAVMHHVAGLPNGTGELPEEPFHGGRHDHASADDAKAGRHDDDVRRAVHRAKVPTPVVRKSKRPHWSVLVGVIVLVGGLVGLSVIEGRMPGTMPWRQGTVYPSAKVKNYEMTREGHAVVTLEDGRKGFVPAKTMRQNPNLLHDLIVAWRQGKPLNVITKTKQHLNYGQEIGITAKSKPGPKAQPKKPH